MRRFVFGLACSTAAVLTTGCAVGGPPSGGSGATGGDTPKQGGVGRFASSGDPPHLDPFDTAVAALHSTGPGMAYSRLLGYEHRPGLPDLAFVPFPDLAERWEQKDPTTYVFPLRKGVKFHNIPPVNGRELTAEDVAYSYNRQREQGRPNGGQLASISAIEATDRHTVTIRLKDADADFLVSLADGHNQVVAREAVELKGDLKNGPTIGTGPWIVDSYEKGAGTFVNRNPDYHRLGLPYLDRVENYTSFTDQAAQLAAFRTGRIDVHTVEPEEALAVTREHPQVRVKRHKGVSTQALYLKQDRAPFNNLRVRQAISKAMDRNQINETAWGGLGWVHAMVYIGEEFFLPKAEMDQRYKRDVEGAKRLLAEAGYPNGFDMEVLVGPLRPGDMPTAELLVAQFKDVNINTKLTVLDYPRYQQQVIARGEFTQAAYGPGSSLPSINAILRAWFYANGPRNINVIKDPALDRMIDQQARETDHAKRKEIVQNIQRHVLDNAYFFVTHANEAQVAMWPYVRDWMPELGYDNMEYTYVWFDK